MTSEIARRCGRFCDGMETVATATVRMGRFSDGLAAETAELRHGTYADSAAPRRLGCFSDGQRLQLAFAAA
jgi:hypothetical protein